MYINSFNENSSLYNNKDVKNSQPILDNKDNNISNILNVCENVSLKNLNTSSIKDKTISFEMDTNNSCVSEFSSKNLSFKTDNENNILEASSKLEGSEELKNLLSKIKPRYELTDDDYKLLNKLSSIAKEKISSSSENLDLNDKMALEKFSTSFDELISYKNEMEVAYKSYVETKKQTDQDVLELTKALGNTLNKLKSNGIEPAMLEQMMKKRIEAGVSVKDLNSIQNGTASSEKIKEITGKFIKVGVSQELINKFLGNYKEVLMAGLIKTTLENYKSESQKAGNEPNTALSLYQSYIQKFIQSLDAGATSNPEKLYEVMASYDDLGEKIKSINESSISNDEKKEQLKSLVSEYTKDNPNQTQLIVSLIDKDFSNELDVSKAVDVLGGAINSLSKNKKMDFISGASKNDLEIAKTASKESYNFIKNDPNIKSLLNRFDSNLSNLSENSNKYIKPKGRFALKLQAMNESLERLYSLSYKKELNNTSNKEIETTLISSELESENVKQKIKNTTDIDLKTSNFSIGIKDSNNKDDFKELKNNNLNNKVRKKLESEIITNSFINNKIDDAKQQNRLEAKKEHDIFTQKLDNNRKK